MPPDKNIPAHNGGNISGAKPRQFMSAVFVFSFNLL